MAFTVPLFTESIRKMQVNAKKVYIIDNGLVRALRLGLTLNHGNLFENQVYLDLRRAGKKVSYYLTEEGYEVDFVAEDQGGSLELIQAVSVWDMSDPETKEREERALVQAEKELGIKGKIVTPYDWIFSRSMI